MDRRSFLKAMGAMAMLPALPRGTAGAAAFTRRRPSDANWPSPAAWKQLSDAVGGNLIPVNFPLSVWKKDPKSAAAEQLASNLKNPYFIGEQAGLTQTLGWFNAWATRPSVYAVAARNAHDIAAAVNFARENNLRLVVKGGGHSYQGTSNAPDSLLIWTRRMREIEMHSAFVPRGCENVLKPQPAVTVGAGTLGVHAYDAVTTRGGKYVQGGGCMTVGLAGLVQGGGFGSFSKRYGLAAGGLLEAEVVTADGQIRIANACTNPDLFWALKGGGGGTFGVVSSMTLLLHDLPQYFGTANFTVKAASADGYKRLIREFLSFYSEHLFNDHWGEQVNFGPDNRLVVKMISADLDGEQASKVWRPFFEFVHSSGEYSTEGQVVIGSIPARHWWDSGWWKEHWPEIVYPTRGPLTRLLDYGLVHLVNEPIFRFDDRPGANPLNAWWEADSGEPGHFLWGYQSLWLPKSLLMDDARERLANALFAGSRHSGFALQFNKGLAGAPSEAIERARDTAMNPAVLSAFALAICADGQGPAYPGIPGYEPNRAEAERAAARIEACMNELRAVAPGGGAYVSESNYFEKGFQQSYWGSNYPRLAGIKKKYDPDGLFIVHNGVGSEEWSADGFTRL